MKHFLSDLTFAIIQLFYYLPIFFGKAVNWKAINYNIFKRKHVKIADIKRISGKIFVSNLGSITIGAGFEANSGRDFNPIGGDTILRLITSSYTANIIIGNNVGISNSTINCYNRIEIGDNVMIGGGVKIWDTNFHSLDATIRVSGNDTDVKTAPVKICDYAFIGANSIIMKGVTVGYNSIIAAGSVVVKNIPDNVIAGGNPCLVIRSI